MFKYGYSRLWTGVKKRPNMVPVDPQTGRVLRAGDTVKIKESEKTFIFRDSKDNKRCICRNRLTGEIIEATLDDMYFQERVAPPSLPDDQKKKLHVCIHYPEDFSFRNVVNRGRIGGGSNHVKNELYYILSKYAPMCHIHLGKTRSSLEDYFFYNQLYQSLRSCSNLQNVELDSYDDDLCYGKNSDGTVNRANLLIVVGDGPSAQSYISVAMNMNIETIVVQ